MLEVKNIPLMPYKKHGRRKTVAGYQIGIIPMLVEVLLAVFFALEPVREPAERLLT